MSRFAEQMEAERRKTVQEAAARLGVVPVIVEKDYWVCWLLGRVFADPEWAKSLVFKGGTSLSKVFRVIDRFSEDIDLSVSPATLGFEESTLDDEDSKSRRAKLFDSLQASCMQFVREKFQPRLERMVAGALGARSGGGPWLNYQQDARTHSPVLNFEYPSGLSPERGYIEPSVKLEFGALTDQQPTGTHFVKPMLADVIPAFTDENDQVVALEVERTFWEKATILHAEFHRPADRPIPDRFARHYSDFAALWGHSAKEKALARLDLLEQVAVFKSRFFGSAWANYGTARRGTLKLSPPPVRVAGLERDYVKMEPMFLKSPPPFARLIRVLGQAEAEINRA